MHKFVFLAAALLAAVSLQTRVATAQVFETPNNCNEFEMTDETAYNGIVSHTPMTLLACQNGMFMDYGPASGTYSGQPFLAANFDLNTSAIDGTVVDYDDGTGCGANSYLVDGELFDGQFLNISGFRPVRIASGSFNACMVTGEVERIDRQFVLVEQPAPPTVSRAPRSSGTTTVTTSAGAASTTTSSSGRSCGINAGTFVGGALGGLVGSQIGGGSGNKAAIAGGALLGALAGTQAACR